MGSILKYLGYHGLFPWFHGSVFSTWLSRRIVCFNYHGKTPPRSNLRRSSDLHHFGAQKWGHTVEGRHGSIRAYLIVTQDAWPTQQSTVQTLDHEFPCSTAAATSMIFMLGNHSDCSYFKVTP